MCNNLKKNILILLLLPTLILVSLIIFCNSFEYNNQNNIHVYHQEIINQINDYHEKSDEVNVLSNIVIQTFQNEKLKVKRMLADTQISTWTANDQINPKVSFLSDGNFVVVWQSYLERGNGWSIYGQIFYNNGAKKGNEFSISNYTIFDQTNPNFAASSSGKFMVVWQENDGNIFGKIFINDGVKWSGQFQINTIINIYQKNPSITALKNNNFVVTWEDSSEAYLQIITHDGNKLSQQLNIASLISPWASWPSTTSLANGNFIVTYRRAPNVYAQVFYENGTMLKPEFLVNTHINHDTIPSISSISTSNFMIVWSSSNQDIIGSNDWGIYGQSFTSSSEKIGNEFRVNTYIISDQINPSITSLVNDNYIVTWESNNQDGNGYGIYGQILDITGNKIGNEFKVNAYANNNQLNPSVSSLINTNFVVVWESYGQDGNSWGIFGNIYQSDGSIVGFDKCSFNCQSCDNKTNCTTCDPNFTIQQNGLCGCLDGFYLDKISTSLCISNLII